VGFRIVHMEQHAWCFIYRSSFLKDGCKFVENSLIEVYSVEWLARPERVDQDNLSNDPKDCEHGFF
jgi:hypothetical protein